MKLKIKGKPGTGNSFSKTRINRVENMCTHAQKVENIHSTTIHLTLNVHMPPYKSMTSFTWEESLGTDLNPEALSPLHSFAKRLESLLSAELSLRRLSMLEKRRLYMSSMRRIRRGMLLRQRNASTNQMFLNAQIFDLSIKRKFLMTHFVKSGEDK